MGHRPGGGLHDDHSLRGDPALIGRENGRAFVRCYGPAASRLVRTTVSSLLEARSYQAAASSMMRNTSSSRPTPAGGSRLSPRRGQDRYTDSPRSRLLLA
jgi:hypothetical protein